MARMKYLVLHKALKEQRPIRELVGDRLTTAELDQALAPTAFFVRFP